MKITVFGGSGFLGSHVSDKLTEANHEVTIFDLKQSPWLRKDQKMVVGDILEQDEVEQAVSDADVVFNFAGIADIGEANEQPINTVRYNILGNAYILEACRLKGVKRYVFASSVYVYSDSGGFYRCSKQACELYIEMYQQNYGLDYTILRYGSLYGPRTDERNAIHRFVKEALENKEISYFGNPEALREYIHVEDAALATVKLLQADYANQRIVLTGNQTIQIKQIVKMISEILKHEVDMKIVKDETNSHYEITPYNFSPRMGKKYSSPLYMDLGQGILKVVEEIHQQLNPDMLNVEGLLIKEDD